MKNRTLQWNLIRENQLNLVSNVDFLAFSNDQRLLFLSLVSGRNLAEEYRRINHQLNLQPGSLQIWVGGLPLGTRAEVDKLELQLMEHLLVNAHNPLLNVPVRNLTSSWGQLEVQNLGFRHLYSLVRLQDGIVFRRNTRSKVEAKAGKSFSLPGNLSLSNPSN
ncbi:MAG: hypothetical protein H6581_16085 [Bacteroidia bacterium]|nr:hypothetical protein [Bacteroidia bacterium]